MYTSTYLSMHVIHLPKRTESPCVKNRRKIEKKRLSARGTRKILYSPSSVDVCPSDCTPSYILCMLHRSATETKPCACEEMHLASSCVRITILVHSQVYPKTGRKYQCFLVTFWGHDEISIPFCGSSPVITIFN
jgi:hypothetical protein